MLSHLSILVSLYAIRAIKAISIFRRRRSEPISAHLWAEINSKKVRPRPERIGGGRGRTPRIAGSVPVLFQFVPKKLEQDFYVFTCGFARFAESCSNSVFRIGTGFFRVYLRFCSFVPIVPVFNKFLYMNTYIDPFLYSFLSCDKLKIIGTNGTFTRNAW